MSWKIRNRARRYTKVSEKTRGILRTAVGLLLIAAAAVFLILPALWSGRDMAVRYPAAIRDDAGETSMPEERGEGTVNPNLADLEELCALPGVGETIARLIIDEREANGPYHYPEDLLLVRGIGEVKLAGLRGLLDLSK